MNELRYIPGNFMKREAKLCTEQNSLIGTGHSMMM